MFISGTRGIFILYNLNKKTHFLHTQVLFQVVDAGGIYPPGYFKTNWVEGLTVDIKVKNRRPGPGR